MGVLSEIVQSGVALADRAQVNNIVEKARGYERLDSLIDLASQHGPAVVKKLDEKVDQVLGGVSDRKAKAMEQYNGAVEFVHQTKGDVLERCNGAKELLEQKKDTVLERCNGAKELLEQKKDTVLEGYNGAKELLGYVQQDALGHYNGAVEFVQLTKGDALERMQKNKDEMLEFVQEKKGDVQSLAQERLPVAAQERISQLNVQVGLVMTFLVAQYHSIVDYPRSLKQRIEQSFPELKQQYAASFETVKNWGVQKFEQLPEMVEMTKTFAAAKSSAVQKYEQLPELVEMAKTWAQGAGSDSKVKAAKLRELAQAQLAATKLLVQAKAAGFRSQLPVYRERVTTAAREAMAWVQTRIQTKQD